MENNIIITVGRQIGSGGLSVASFIAKKLDVEVYDRNLLMLAAKESGISQEIFADKDEKPATMSRFAQFLGIRSSVYTSAQAFTEPGALTDDELFTLQGKVIKTIAAKGSGVFVGRCADYVLRNEPGLFSVFVTADMEDRIARIMEREKISADAARKYIENGQRKRSYYYNYYTFKKWGDSTSYDLCINSSRYGLETTADIIVDLYKKFREKRCAL